MFVFVVLCFDLHLICSWWVSLTNPIWTISWNVVAACYSFLSSNNDLSLQFKKLAQEFREFRLKNAKEAYISDETIATSHDLTPKGS